LPCGATLHGCVSTALSRRRRRRRREPRRRRQRPGSLCKWRRSLYPCAFPCLRHRHHCEQRWIEGWYPAPISSWHGNIQGWYRRQQQQHKLTIGGVLFWSLPACRPAALPPSRPAIFIRDYVKKSGRHPPKLVRSLYPPAKAPPVRREPQRAHVLALRDAESVPVRGLVNIKGTHGAPWWRSARAAQHYLVPVTIHRRRHMWRRHSGSSPRRKSADSYSLARLLLHTGWHIAR